MAGRQRAIPATVRPALQVYSSNTITSRNSSHVTSLGPTLETLILRSPAHLAMYLSSRLLASLSAFLAVVVDREGKPRAGRESDVPPSATDIASAAATPVSARAALVTPRSAPRSSTDAVRAAGDASLADHLEATLKRHARRPAGRHPPPAASGSTADDVALARLVSDVALRGHEVTSVPGEAPPPVGSSPSTPPTTPGSARSGRRRCSPATLRRRPWPTPSSTPPASCRRCGSRAPSRTTRLVSGGTFDLWVAPEVAQGADRRRRGGRRHRGLRLHRGPVVHRARRPRRQQGVRLHVPGPASASPTVTVTSGNFLFVGEASPTGRHHQPVPVRPQQGRQAALGPPPGPGGGLQGKIDRALDMAAAILPVLAGVHQEYLGAGAAGKVQPVPR